MLECVREREGEMLRDRDGDRNRRNDREIGEKGE